MNRHRAGFRFVEGGVQDVDLSSLLQGITHVFHLAAQAGVRRSWGRDFRVYTDNNVDASQQLLKACVGRPLNRFVYASSSSVYGDSAAIPMREDVLPQPVSVWSDQAGGRTALSPVFRQSRRSGVDRQVIVRREPAQKGDMRDTYADTAMARNDLGFIPRVTLEQGLESEYRWLSTTPALL